MTFSRVGATCAVAVAGAALSDASSVFRRERDRLWPRMTYMADMFEVSVVVEGGGDWMRVS